MTGKAGIVHLHLGDGVRGLEMVRRALAQSELPPRVFNPTHVNRRRPLFDEAVDLARAGCTVDVTAFPVADGEDAYSASEALLRYLSSGAPPEHVTVGSDTVVDLDGRTLGKPRSDDEAREMLAALSGRSHEVHTAFALRDPAGAVAHIEAVTTRVRFAPLSDELIEFLTLEAYPYLD